MHKDLAPNAFTTVYTTNVTATKLSTLLVSYNFPVQINAGSFPCVVIARVLLDGVATHDHSMTSLTPTPASGTVGGVSNTLAFSNVAPGTHQISLEFFAGCNNASVTFTFYFGGVWGPTFTAAFLNQ